MPPDQVLDLGRIEVDAAHREHIVNAAADPSNHLCERAAAFARLPSHLDPVAGPVADQRRSPAAEVGRDQLPAARSGLRQRMDGASIVADFEDELRLDQVDTVTSGARNAGRTKL